MNAMTPPLKPRSGVLEVTPGRVRVFTDPETALDWTRPEDFAQGDAVQAIVLHAAPDAPELPRHVRAALAGLLGHVPFFAVPSGAPDCPLRRWAEAPWLDLRPAGDPGAGRGPGRLAPAARAARRGRI